MNNNTHIVQKQVVEFGLCAGEDPFAAQKRLEYLLEEKLYPKLEPLFDQLAGPEHWIEIDTLEIDLGDMSLSEDDGPWLEKAYTVFSEALKVACTSTSSTISKSEREQNQNCLAYFLRHGYLPWWASDVDLDKLANEQIRQHPTKLLALLEFTQARLRWAQQFPEMIQGKLATTLKLRLPITLASWQSLFTQQHVQRATLIYWISVWEAASQETTSYNHEKWESILVRNLINDETSIFMDAQTLENILATDLLFKPAKMALQEFFSRLNRISTKIKPDQEKEQSLDLLSEPRSGASEELLSKLDQKFKQITSSLNSERSNSEAEAEGIYISLAGSILVHPFLPALFNKLDLLEEDQFVDAAAQERAVHLLYYIATQQPQPLESEMVLLKVLCGISLGTPIARTLNLTTDEKQEADRMLQALIEHWPAIEGTTTEELRGTFFLREGKLVSADTGWQLTVEQTGFDVMLGQLPWGLSPIMHPWMESMLWVDWA